MFKSTVLSLTAAILMFSVNPGYADETGNANMQIHKAHGVVNKIYETASKVSITHDAIPSLKWSKMTMDFIVQDKAGLAALKPGMAVDFDIAMQGRNYHISRIVPAR